MLLRGTLVTLAAAAKSIGAVDLAMRYNPVVRRPVRTAIRRCRTADPPVLRALTAELTAGILKYARKTEYGRGFGSNIADWPILSKELVRKSPLSFTTSGVLRVPAATGGTTGIPLRLSRSMCSIVAEQVFLDGLLAPYGLNWASARIAVLRGDLIKSVDDTSPPFGKQVHAGRRLILSSPHLGAASLDWYLDRLTAFRPDILFAYPTTVGHLLSLLARSQRRLRVPFLVVSSERLDSGLYTLARHGLDTTIIDYYGLAERSVFAVRKAEDQWFFEPAYGKVELTSTPADEIIDGGEARSHHLHRFLE